MNTFFRRICQVGVRADPGPRFIGWLRQSGTRGRQKTVCPGRECARGGRSLSRARRGKPGLLIRSQERFSPWASPASRRSGPKHVHQAQNLVLACAPEHLRRRLTNHLDGYCRAPLNKATLPMRRSRKALVRIRPLAVSVPLAA